MKTLHWCCALSTAFWLLSPSVSQAADAQTDPSSAALDAPKVEVEVRTLKQGSAIRAEIERHLGKHRVAADFTLRVQSALGANGSGSLIDVLEAATRTKTDWDPYANPIEPNGPGSRVGQPQSTHVNCASIATGSGPQAGNVTWNWLWQPDSDTNGDGRITSTDSCPCSWVLQTTQIEWSTAAGPLDC